MSFDPITLIGSERLFAAPKDRMKLLTHVPSHDKNDSVIRTTTRGMHTSMLPGAPLLEMNSRALNGFAVFLNEIRTTEQPRNLYTWIRDCFTLASAEALYGPINPISEDNTLIQSLECVPQSRKSEMVKDNSNILQRLRELRRSSLYQSLALVHSTQSLPSTALFCSCIQELL